MYLFTLEGIPIKIFHDYIMKILASIYKFYDDQLLTEFILDVQLNLKVQVRILESTVLQLTH